MSNNGKTVVRSYIESIPANLHDYLYCTGRYVDVITKDVLGYEIQSCIASKGYFRVALSKDVLAGTDLEKSLKSSIEVSEVFEINFSDKLGGFFLLERRILSGLNKSEVYAHEGFSFDMRLTILGESPVNVYMTSDIEYFDVPFIVNEFLGALYS